MSTHNEQHGDYTVSYDSEILARMKAVEEARRRRNKNLTIGGVGGLLAVGILVISISSCQEQATRQQAGQQDVRKATTPARQMQRVTIKPGEFVTLLGRAGYMLDYETERSACIVRIARSANSSKYFIDTICDPGKAPNCLSDRASLWRELKPVGPLPQGEPISEAKIALVDCGGPTEIQYTYRAR
jgi:hypothetical protein